MDQIGHAVSRGFGGLSNAVGNVVGGAGGVAAQTADSLDRAIHQFVPADIPTWLVVGVAILALGYFVFRR